jgi:hypothetical protein
MVEAEIVGYFGHNEVKKDGFCTDLVKHGLAKTFYSLAA